MGAGRRNDRDRAGGYIDLKRSIGKVWLDCVVAKVCGIDPNADCCDEGGPTLDKSCGGPFVNGIGEVGRCKLRLEIGQGKWHRPNAERAIRGKCGAGVDPKRGHIEIGPRRITAAMRGTIANSPNGRTYLVNNNGDKP